MNLNKQITEEEWIELMNIIKLPEKDIDEVFDDSNELPSNGLGDK